jgi:tripartite-type tricarboxylate transporter receptor subunit TctC
MGEGGPRRRHQDAVIAGEAYSGLAGAIQGGTVKALAVASPQRLPGFPDLPTVSETIPDFVAMGWQAMVAPVGTPDAIVRKVSEDLRKVQDEPGIKARFLTLGSHVRSMSPAEVTAFIQAEQRMWAPVLQRIAGSP